MTPSQTQALKLAKDELVKKYGYTDFYLLACDFVDSGDVDFIDELATLYHTRLLAEAGKEVSINDILMLQWDEAEYGMDLTTAENILDFFIPLLAAKQGEIERLSGWKREAMAVYGPLLDYGQNEMGLKPGESIVTKAIERLKEYSNLKSQLEAAQAERDELRQGQIGLLQYQQKLLAEIGKLKQQGEDAAEDILP